MSAKFEPRTASTDRSVSVPTEASPVAVPAARLTVTPPVVVSSTKLEYWTRSKPPRPSMVSLPAPPLNCSAVLAALLEPDSESSKPEPRTLVTPPKNRSVPTDVSPVAVPVCPLGPEAARSTVTAMAATRAADNGATVAQLNAIFGWTGSAMASLCTQEADRRRLALEAAHKLANNPQTSIPAPLQEVREAGNPNEIKVEKNIWCGRELCHLLRTSRTYGKVRA